MSDSFTEVTRRGWFSRIAGSFVGVLFGLLLIIGMIVLLFWNEGRAVQTALSLTEGAGTVIAASADRIDPAHEGKLVHVSGTVTTDEVLRDEEFGIEARAVSLIRRAEMYQWIEDSRSETRKTLGGGEETVTTYSYKLAWDDRAVDSSRFRQPDGHANPEMRWTDRTFALSSATIGARTLDVQTLTRIGGEEERPVTSDDAAAIRSALGGRDAQVTSGEIYIGPNPSSPQLGDQRISYAVVPLGPISVIGRQEGDGLVPYQTSAGDALLMVDRGTVPAAQMFEQAQADNVVVTWVLRGVGLVLLAFGFALIMGPIGTIADVIPFLGSLVRLGTGLVAIVLAIAVGTIVIAFAWFWYRPLLALAILAAGFAISWLLARWGRRRGATAPAAPAPA